jgi:hypothetical protein
MRKTTGQFGVSHLIVDKPDALRRGAKANDFASLDSAISRALLKEAAVFKAHEAWIEIPLGNEWTAACRLLPQNGVPVIGELRIFPYDPSERRHSAGRWSGEFAGKRAHVPAGGLSSRLLRTLRLSLSGALWKRYRHQLLELPGDQTWLSSYHGFSLGAGNQPKRPYRRGRPDIFYARLAQRYCKLFDSGVRNPVQSIAGSIKESPSKVRDMILQARKRGLLTRPPKQGRMGGLLTPKAKIILKKARSPKGRKKLKRR